MWCSSTPGGGGAGELHFSRKRPKATFLGARQALRTSLSSTFTGNKGSLPWGPAVRIVVPVNVPSPPTIGLGLGTSAVEKFGIPMKFKDAYSE